MRRRDFLYAALGFGIGGALAAGAGLSYRYLRRQAQAPAVARQPVTIERGLENWVLTEADHQDIAARSAAPPSDTFEILDNVDIQGGGDLRALRVSTAADCATACAADDACHAFTYARLSHPTDRNRQMCWLKSGETPERLISNLHYVSGRKP